MKRFTRKAVAALALIVIPLSLTACGGGDSGGSDGGGGDSEIVIGYLPFGEQMQIKLADNQGIFKDHDVKLKYGNAAASGPAQMTQLLNGQLDVAITTIGSVITAQASDIDVKVVGAISKDYNRDGQTAYNIIVTKDSPLKTLADLDGKTVAINSLASSSEVDLRETIDKTGGDPASLNLVQIAFPSMAAAVRDKKVDAAYLIQPFASSLIAQGFRSIGDSQAEALGDPESTNTVLVMSAKYLKENAESAKRFLEAMTEASEYANSNPDKVRDTLAVEAKLPPETAAKAPVPSYTTAINEDNVATWVQLFAKFKVIDKELKVSDVLWDGAPLAK